MSKFNTPSTGSKVINRAGGEAYDMSDKEKLATLLLTSFVKSQFYRSEADTIEEVKQLVAADPIFAAKASIYARREYGMRSITHVTAGELFRTVSGEKWVKNYIDRVVYRPDDMSEIVAYYTHNVARKKSAPLPGQLKKGLAHALTRFNEYQLAKYRGDNKEWSLVDIANLVRPQHTEALAKLIKGELKNTETWEAKLSASSGDDTKKADAWRSLLTENKLGYFALLRNLNNIADQAPEALDKALETLVNEQLIRKSLVMPLHFITAIDHLDNSANRVKITRALNRALELSLVNVPHYDGKTLVVIDTSGSMYPNWGSKGVINQAAVFGAVLAKTNEADLMLFSDGARYLNYNPDDSLGTIAQTVISAGDSGGTNFHAPFQTANQAYDRMVILSDEQGWMGYNSPAASLEAYKTRLNAKPFVYMWDLAGYGSLQLPKNQVALLAGFSDKVFDVMKLLETDRHALVTTIEDIEL